MNPRTVTWNEVGAGMYVQGPDGVAWRVEDRRENQYLLVSRDGQRVAHTAAPDRPVTLLEPTHDEAVATAVRQLGGEVVAEKEPDREWKLAPLRRNLLQLQGHLFQFHGYWAKDMKKIDEILAFHGDDHVRGGSSHAYIPHNHTAQRSTS